MEIDGTRILVAGATGALGGAIARALHEAGARLALAGRDVGRLGDLGAELDASTHAFDALDLDRCAALVDEAAHALGGLGGLVVAIGIAAFGPESENDVVTEHLLAVNTMAPMALVRAALPHLSRGGSVTVLSAILADVPTAGMAAYSASKAALSAWLTALRGEQRRAGITVFDVRPPHIETGLAGRAIAGTAPKLTAAAEVDEVVALIVDGIRDGRRELRYDLRERAWAGR